MKKLLFLILFATTSFCFGADKQPDKRPLKSMDKVVSEMEERICKKLDNVYAISEKTDYIISNNDKTCEAKININIIVDGESVKNKSKEEIEKIFNESLIESIEGFRCWAFFFCEVKKASLEYKIIPVKVVYKKKPETKKKPEVKEA